MKALCVGYVQTFNVRTISVQGKLTTTTYVIIFIFRCLPVAQQRTDTYPMMTLETIPCWYLSPEADPEYINNNASRL